VFLASGFVLYYILTSYATTIFYGAVVVRRHLCSTYQVWLQAVQQCKQGQV
jgi:hypothetical protein